MTEVTGWDANGNPTEIELPGTGRRITQSFNANNLLATRTTELGGDDKREEKFQYNNNLALWVHEVKLNDGDWRQTVYTYDPDGRLKQITFPSGLVRRFQYDVDGQLAEDTYSKGTESHTTTYGYDGEGRLETATYESGKSFTFHYDKDGRLTSVDWDGTQLYSYEHDGAKRLKKITDKASSTCGGPQRITFTPDSVGYPYKRRLLDVLTDDEVEITQKINDVNAMDGQSTFKVGGTPIAQVVFGTGGEYVRPVSINWGDEDIPNSTLAYNPSKEATGIDHGCR